MTAATHRLGGAAAGMALSAWLPVNIAEGMLLVGMAVLGSIIPDIDNPHSSISYKWRGVSWIVTISQTLIHGVSHLFPKKQAAYIRSLIGHRGFTHSLFSVAILTAGSLSWSAWAGLAQVGYYMAVGLAGGMLSHIVFDMLAGGVPLLIPFSTKRICLSHIKTGGVGEWIFRFNFILVLICMGLEELLVWLK